MYKLAAARSDANKITPVKGDTLASIAASGKCDPNTSWQHLALYNWGTTDAFEVNRALIELVGCSKVDEVNPENSLIYPDLGTTKVLHAPKAWPMPAPLPVEKTHTITVRRRRPPPAAVLTKVDPWFIPEDESCDIGWRIEGVRLRADKLDFDVFASNYCQATVTVDEGFVSASYAPLDVPIFQKRAFVPADERKAATIVDWKGESEAADGVLKPRAGAKRHVDVACSPYTVQLRYYKVDADKDARITLKPFWPRFKKVYKDAAKTTALDAPNAGALKGKTEAAVTTVRDLEASLRLVDADVSTLLEASERAALRAHGAAKAAAKAVADVDTAKTTIDQCKTDTDDASAAATTRDNTANDAASDPTNVAKQTSAANALTAANTKWGTAIATAKDAGTKAETAHASSMAAALSLSVAKAAAARALAAATASQTRVNDLVTKLALARTGSDEADTAASSAPKAPDSLKDAGSVAAAQAATAKIAVDELPPAVTALVTAATTCRDNADTVSATGATAKTDATAMKDGADARIASPPTWTDLTNRSATAATRAATAKTKADQAKTEAEALARAADEARTHVAKLLRLLAKAKTDVAQWVIDVQATDDHVVYDASLEVRWKIEKSNKLVHGQLLIVDRDNKPVFRKPLTAAELTAGTEVVCKPADPAEAKYWLDDKNQLQMSLAGMPWRVQVQAHSDWDQDDGVALVAMQTEVRLWAHKDTGRHADPLDDVSSLHLALAPWRPEDQPPAAGSYEWYKLKLAELGYHPGPVNAQTPSKDPKDPFRVSLTEFQRSFPKEEAAPFTRLSDNGGRNSDSRAVLERTDIADKAHDKGTTVKADTKATHDAALAAKPLAVQSAADAAVAQTAGTGSNTDATQAAALADRAALDAEAAKAAMDQALKSVKAADTRLAWKADALATTARAAITSAKLAATAAKASAVAAAQALAATRIAATTFDDAMDRAKASSDSAAAGVQTAKSAADQAVWDAAGADPGVTAPVLAAGNQALSAHVTATQLQAAATGARADGADMQREFGVAEQAANKAVQEANGLESAVAQLESSAGVGAKFSLVRPVADSSAGLARTAKAAADDAKAKIQAWKTRTQQAKDAADTAKSKADQLVIDVDALIAQAKLADDAAELDRLAKQQRKAQVDKVMRPSLAMFGNPTDRSDFDRATAEPLLGDKSKELIVWIDDCHYYTAGATISGMKNYRGPMKIGDGKVEADRKSIPRPWIPVESHVPLLGKGQALAATGAPPAMTMAMRQAIGPIRVDWSFDELAPDMTPVGRADTDDAKLVANHERATAVKAATAEVLVAEADAKPTIDPVVTHLTDAQKQVDDLVPLVDEVVDASALAATDLEAAQAAADQAAQDAIDAATAVTSADVGAAAKVTAAKVSAGDAAAKAAAAVRSAGEAATKATATKPASASMATEAAAAKTDATTFAGKVADMQAKIEAADIAAEIADSASSVRTEILQTRTAGNETKGAADTLTTSVAQADTASAACRDDAVTAETAALLAKSRAEALQVAADQAKTLTDAEDWAGAPGSAQAAALLAADGVAAAEQAKKDADALKANTQKAKTDLESAKTAADEAKTAVDAVHAPAQSADSAADVDRLSRVGGATAAAGRIDPAVARAAGARSRTYLSEVLGSAGMGKTHDGRLYTNCPDSVGGVDVGGIRPAALDTYYKAAFGLDKEGCNRPWRAVDDAANKLVFSLVHDDLGQDKDLVFPGFLGKAGICLNPSRIAGDGYRYRARVSFLELPGGVSHPNREALLGRYEAPPLAHTAGLRLWRKASMRGYVNWMSSAVAGVPADSKKMAAYYAEAHVHVAFEGDSQAGPPEFTPVGSGANDLIDAATYRKCVDDKLKAGPGDYAGKSAFYTAGYVWPYLNLKGWGIKPQAVSLDAYVKFLYGKFEETSWDLYSNELIHKLIEGAEKKKGLLRGHVLAEFHSSPPAIVIEYKCSKKKAHKVCEVANDPAGASTHVDNGVNVTYTRRIDGATSCVSSGCKGKYSMSGSRVISGGLPLCAIGQSLGGCWLYTPRSPATWAHEVGHHRHLQHAQAYDGETKIAPGGQLTQHDSRSNAYQSDAPSTFQRGWDRTCIMSYDKQGYRHFCGKCLLKNRGWAVESIADPAAEAQDA